MKYVEFKSSTPEQWTYVVITIVGYGRWLTFNNAKVLALHDLVVREVANTIVEYGKVAGVYPTYGKDTIQLSFTCHPTQRPWIYLRTMEYVVDSMRLRLRSSTYAPSSYTDLPSDHELRNIRSLDFLADDTDPLVQEMNDALLVDTYRRDLAKAVRTRRTK